MTTKGSPKKDLNKEGHSKSMAWLLKVSLTLQSRVFLPIRLYVSGSRHLITVSMCCSFFPCIEPHDYIMESFHQWNKCSLNRFGACIPLVDTFAYGSLYRKCKVIWIALVSHNWCSLYFPRDFLILKFEYFSHWLHDTACNILHPP